LDKPMNMLYINLFDVKNKVRELITNFVIS
jgi:hypothetical protein